MQILNRGPNMTTIYRYMKSKGYDADYDCNSGKRMVIFTKTIHNPEFPKLPCLKGLVVVHKIRMDVQCGALTTHWLENRGLPITGRDYMKLLEELVEQSIKSYIEIKNWMKRDWLYQAIAELEKNKKK